MVFLLGISWTQIVQDHYQDPGDLPIVPYLTMGIQYICMQLTTLHGQTQIIT